MVRTYEDEMKFVSRETPTRFSVAKGFVPNMKVGVVYGGLAWLGLGSGVYTQK